MSGHSHCLLGFSLNYPQCRQSVHPAGVFSFGLDGCGPAAYPRISRACQFPHQDVVPHRRLFHKSFVPVAGVDVSKRFSGLCVLSPDNNVLLRQKIYHDMVSLKLAEKKLHEIKLEYGTRPVVVMESTSHYHLILFQFFTDAGFEVVVVNPIQSGALKNINVRKVKNDRVDAYRIAMLYRLKVLRPSQIPTSSLRGLRLLTRQRSELKGALQKQADGISGSDLPWIWRGVL